MSLDLPVRGAAPRILIVRVSALGDIVFATSLLHGLRQRWPDAHIDWAVQSGFAGVLENDTRINRLIRLPTRLRLTPGVISALRAEFSKGAYDWVIDAQGLLKTRFLARLVPNAYRIGFESKEPGACWMDQLLPKGGAITDIASEYRFLAQSITAMPAPAPRLNAIDHKAVLKHAADYTVLCPFTTRPQKHWMQENWGQLAALIHARGLGPVVLMGGPGDVAAARDIEDTLPQGSINLVGKTRLDAVAGVIAGARLLIGVDTGLTHIGIATGRPVVALFGSTCPYTGGADSPLRVMYDALPCAPCKRRPSCNGAFDCMRGLSPERVCAAATQLIGA
ncbi:MAG: glycosyltransferase family 9 protein [Panacagrimonas sp.]